MIHIKTYENINQDRHWKVKTATPEFEISLDKIVVPKDKKLSMLEQKQYAQIKEFDYVYVGVDYAKWNSSGIWTWDEDGYGMSRYMGEIEVTQDDIIKWKFDNDIKIYNL